MNRRILAVDDEQSIVRLIEVTLTRKGYEVITATNGREALCVAETERPDLILMDVMMPYMDGFEAMRHLKANEATRGIPVIMLTAKRHDADMIRGMESGAVSYLTKPFSPTELSALVEKILGQAGTGKTE
jgi:DNA-binding response OmpR family regulator